MTVFPSLFRSVLFVLITAALQFNLWAEEPKPMRDTSIFSFEQGNEDLSAWNMDNPSAWFWADDALVYKHDAWGFSMATFDPGVNDYRIDAEVNLGRAEPDNPKLVNPGADNSIGIAFRRQGDEAAVFYMGSSLGGGLVTLRLLPYIKSPFLGKDVLYGMSPDTLQDFHKLTLLVKGDLVNAYVDGQLACVGDLSDRPSGEVGLVSSFFGDVRSFKVTALNPSIELESQRPTRPLLDKGAIYQTPHTWQDAVRKSMNVLDDAIAEGTEGVPGYEDMPAYTYRCVIWMKDGLRPFFAYPAHHHAQTIQALIAYSDYSSNPKYLDEAIRLGDWTIGHLTPADAKLPHCAYSTTYNGEMAGNVDGETIMLDKVGAMGEALLALWKRTGNDEYKQAAIKMGETLLEMQLPEGRWQCRIEYKTGKVVQDYVSNQVFNIRFMDVLHETTGDPRYSVASRKALKWTLNNPVKTWRWTGFYEDVVPQEVSLGNYDATATALYLLKHREQNPEYLAIAVDITDWIATSFAVKHKGRWPLLCEQTVCMPPMTGHSLHYATLLRAVHEATGKKKYLDAARSTVNAGVDCTVSWDDPAIHWYYLHAMTVHYLLDLGPKLDAIEQSASSAQTPVGESDVSKEEMPDE